jgi:hypothetical protein
MDTNRFHRMDLASPTSPISIPAFALNVKKEPTLYITPMETQPTISLRT